MGQLELALIQTDLTWADAETNRSHLTALFDTITDRVDLVILPEMFTSAFDTSAKAMAEEWPGPTVDWLRTQATRLDAAITGSIAVLDQGKRYNRLLFVTPDQQVFHYDKRHLFRMLGEHERYAGGSQQKTITWRGWRILPLVCYDLRFPVWCRNTPELNYDLMLFVANWPSARSSQWTTLLQARAIENLAYVAGVNRTGCDAKGLEYKGASAVEAPDGTTLVSADDKPHILRTTLSREWLRQYRDSFPAYLDADHFELRL